MPTDTIYVSEKYGKEYDGGSCREGSATDPASVYLQYPSSLKQLRKLCNELQEADSFEEAERFVEETLKRQAVYDVNPGSTPSGEDFAEYFLFENHKGFCVHFATAATLMYRMLGIPARFAEGYAIPASAFSQQENGQYVAAWAMPGVKSGRRIPAGRSRIIQVQLLRWKMWRGQEHHRIRGSRSERRSSSV